ncbi:5-carboxymethyl-2-hydroxymuconate isomerase [Puniceibacterium sp. HSS470]|jgi:5-carboxymethyl-2-hydroxymuconate isomerase|nr:5-carboxymethyl-2-hydroxymuconate isomerase [Puniceibacterium sp. HSS470]|tara:strand:- start:28522 stop:28866 length:345 start_codon:yes stop_codon:yes gene_type:complete
MPHFVIEQGNALLTPQDRADALRLAGQIGADCGFIAAEDIKLRILDVTDFLMLDGREGFLHLSIHMLAGRSCAQKETLTIALRDAFSARFPGVDSLSFACVDMDPVSYKKHLRT